MRSIQDVRRVEALVAAGLNDCAIARSAEIPRGTVRGWRHERRWEQWPYTAHSIFCDACDLLDIEWRVMNARNISVARRASVARLDEFVGPKR